MGVALKTLGCKVNRVESEDIAADLLGRGVQLVGEEHAAVVIVNTCTVTGEADAKARKAVRHALNARSNPVVVVTGCMAAISRASLEALGERVVVEVDKDAVVWRVAEALERVGDGDIAGVGVATPAAAASGAHGGSAFRTRAMVKIEDGCDAFCSYCIVPYARGGPRPTPLTKIEADAAGLVSRGVREIVLTGVNLGRYDDRGRTLADVVSAVASSGIERLRLSSIEPLDLTERLLATMAELPAVCAHLHVPLQSGSDAVLQRMARRYTAGEFTQAVGLARAALPGLAVTTDVIAGFPGETDADAQATLDVCRATGFARLHVFRYSEREGTPAVSMPGRVDAEVRAARAAALRELDAELQSGFARAHGGTVVEVLVERVARSGANGTLATGTARDYLKVEVECEREAGIGDLVTAEVTDVHVTPARARQAAVGASG